MDPIPWTQSWMLSVINKQQSLIDSWQKLSWSMLFWFLADCTIGLASGTLSSVCCLSVMFCIVAKRYVLAKNCLKERLGNHGQKFDFLGRRHISTSSFAATATMMAVFALFLPVQPSDRYQMVQVDLQAANYVRIVGLCGQNWNRK